MSELNTRHISSNLSTYESARTGFFSFVLPEDAISKITEKARQMSPNRLANLSDGQLAEAIRLNTTKFPVPSYKLDTLEFVRGNEKVKFAGTPTFDGGSFDVDDIIGLDTYSMLLAWWTLAYDIDTGKGGKMADYKYDVVVIEYNQNYEQIRKWNLIGFFVTEVSKSELDAENDAKQKINCTFVYDRAKMIIDRTQNS